MPSTSSRPDHAPPHLTFRRGRAAHAEPRQAQATQAACPFGPRCRHPPRRSTPARLTLLASRVTTVVVRVLRPPTAGRRVSPDPSSRAWPRPIDARSERRSMRGTVGRKSRAKAERRAERARVMIQASDRPAGDTGVRPEVRLPMLVTARPVDAPRGWQRIPERDQSTAADHLRTLVTKHRELLGEIEEEVRSLVNEGHSWTVVGNIIGISRQAARQRYRHLVAHQPETGSGTAGSASWRQDNR